MKDASLIAAPLDLSFLAGWEFIAGVGKYDRQQACVMSAAAAYAAAAAAKRLQNRLRHIDALLEIVLAIKEVA